MIPLIAQIAEFKTEINLVTQLSPPKQDSPKKSS